MHAKDKRTAGNHQGETQAVHELFLQSAVSLSKAHTGNSQLRLSGPVLLCSVTQKSIQESQICSGITENRLGPKHPTGTSNIPVLSKLKAFWGHGQSG